jgi:hypothetical protein
MSVPRPTEIAKAAPCTLLAIDDPHLAKDSVGERRQHLSITKRGPLVSCQFLDQLRSQKRRPARCLP